MPGPCERAQSRPARPRRPNVRLCRLIYDDYQSKRPDSGTATSSQLE
ncbi:Uncharacterised protein [Bordetella pertussis]|nr:Uncharacterised protein [Bordetella pertussis]